METAPSTANVGVARAACLIALAVYAPMCLLLATESPNSWFPLVVALAAAAVLRAAVVLSRGDAAVFALLWAAFGVSLGMTLVGAFSVGAIFLLIDAVLVLAIATAPNRTGRSRSSWPFVAVQALGFLTTIALPFVVG